MLKMSATRSNRNGNPQLLDPDGGVSDPEESQIIEERLKNLLRSTTGKSAAKARSIFNNFQGDAPKLRNSVISRALQKVVCSTPMPSEKYGDFFPSETSFNISPIDPTAEESSSSNNQDDKDERKLSKKDVVFDKEPKVVLNRAPTIIILSSSSETENQSPNKVNNKSVENKTRNIIKIVPYNTRRQSKNHERSQRILTVSQDQECSNIVNRGNKKTHRPDPTEKTTKIPIIRSRSRSKEKLGQHNSNNPAVKTRSELYKSDNKFEESPPKSPPKRPPRRKKGACKSTCEIKSNTKDSTVDPRIRDELEHNPNMNETFTSNSRIIVENVVLQPENVSVRETKRIQTKSSQVINKISPEKKSNCSLELKISTPKETLTHSKRMINLTNPETVTKGTNTKISLADTGTSPCSFVPILENGLSTTRTSLGTFTRSKRIVNSSHLETVANGVNKKISVAAASPRSFVQVLENELTDTRASVGTFTRSKQIVNSTHSESVGNGVNKKISVAEAGTSCSFAQVLEKELSDTRASVDPLTRSKRIINSSHSESVANRVRSSTRSFTHPLENKLPPARTSVGTSPIIFDTQSSIVNTTIVGTAAIDEQNACTVQKDLPKDKSYVTTKEKQLRGGNSFHSNTPLNKTVCPKRVGVADSSSLGNTPHIGFNRDTITDKDKEKLNRLLIKMSQKLKNSCDTPNENKMSKTVNQCLVKKDENIASTPFESPSRKISRNRITREVQTSLRRSCRITPKKSFAEKIFTRTLIEQQTQTTSSIGSRLKTYRRNKSKNKRVEGYISENSSRNTSTTDQSEVLKEIERENMLFQSLTEGIFPPSFSSSEDESVVSVNEENRPWRLDNDIIKLPRRSSYNLNFLRSAREIELERKSSMFGKNNFSDSDSEVEEKRLEKKKKPNGKRQLAYTRKNKLQVEAKSSEGKDSSSVKTHSEELFTDEERSSSSTLIGIPGLELGEDAFTDNEPICNEGQPPNISSNDVIIRNCENANLETVLTTKNLDAHNKSYEVNVPLENRVADLLSRSPSSPLQHMNKGLVNTTNSKKVSACRKEDDTINDERNSKDLEGRTEDDEILAIPLEDSDVPDVDSEEIFTNQRVTRFSKDQEVHAVDNSELTNVRQQNEKIQRSHKKTPAPAVKEVNNSELTNVQSQQNEKTQRSHKKTPAPAVNEVNNSELTNVRQQNEKTQRSHKKTPAPAVNEVNNSELTNVQSQQNEKTQRSHKKTPAPAVNEVNNSELTDVQSQQKEKIQMSNKKAGSPVNEVESNSTPSPKAQTKEPEFKVPKRRGRKPKKQIESESDDGVSSTTVDSTEHSGVRRSGRERKPTQRRALGVVATYNQKDLLYYNGTNELSTNFKSNATINKSSKSRTKKQNNTKKKLEMKEKEKSTVKKTRRSEKSQLEPKEQGEPEIIRNSTTPIADRECSQNEPNVTAQTVGNTLSVVLSKLTERKKRNSSIISSTTNDTASNETPAQIPEKKNRKTSKSKQSETRRKSSNNHTNSKRIFHSSDISHISCSENFTDDGHVNTNEVNVSSPINNEIVYPFSAEIFSDEVRNGDTDEFSCPTEAQGYNNTAEHNKNADKDSGRSTMLKSATFDDSHSKFSKPLTGRIGKKYKKRGDNIGNKICKVLSRSVNRPSEFELLDGGKSNGTMSASRLDDKTARRSSLMQSKFTEGDHINLLYKSDIVSMKYVDQDANYRVVRDNLMVTDSLKVGDGTIGYLKLLPGCQKPLHIARKYNLGYFVIEGEGLIQVHNKTSRIGKLSRFGIPLGVEYSINNLSKEEPLVLAFVKMPPNSDSQCKTTV